jgi:hypothetical protein
MSVPGSRVSVTEISTGLGHKVSCLRILSGAALGDLGTAGVIILACRAKRTDNYIPITRPAISQLGSLTLFVLLHRLLQMVLHMDPTQACPSPSWGARVSLERESTAILEGSWAHFGHSST